MHQSRRLVGITTWGVVWIGAGAAAAGMAACISSSGGNGTPDAGFSEFDATFDGGEDAVATDSAPSEASTHPDGAMTACTDAGTGPLALTCADYPGVAPCPNQALLTDPTKFAALQTAMKSGALLLENDAFNSGNADIYKVLCGLEGYWDPSVATTLIPPATGIPELASLFAPSPDGFAGVCAKYMAWSAAGDGFPAAGTYRKQLRAMYGGQTYTVRVRYTAGGTAAGQTFEAAGLSDGDYLASTDVAGALVFKVNGTPVPEATLWSSLVGAFTASTTGFPSATIAVSESAAGPTIWTGTFDLLCASVSPDPDAGPTEVTQQSLIPVPGSPGALGYNAGTKKAYVALTTVSDAGFTTPAGIAVISDTSGAVVGNIATSNVVVALVANGTTSTVYASEQSQIDVIDSTKDAITTTVAPPNGESAQGMAVDETANKIYVLGGSHINVLDGATKTFSGNPYPFMGMTPPTAAFTGGKPAIALDATTGTLYAIGLDASLNGVVESFNASTGALLQTYSLMANQPTAIVAVPGGAVATVVSASGGGVVLVGQAATATTFGGSSLATCGSKVAIIGSDSTGLAMFATYAPTASALGQATMQDATWLALNGGVPALLVPSGTVGSGCTFYGTYGYNPNALYSGGSLYTPPPPAYVVKFASD